MSNNPPNTWNLIIAITTFCRRCGSHITSDTLRVFQTMARTYLFSPVSAIFVRRRAYQAIAENATNFYLPHSLRFHSKMSDFKVFNDMIHGHMNFHPLIVVFADTMQIQRLRNIKQLGIGYFVFPSASHNRFEHSLGTAYIAGKLFDSLREKGMPVDIPDSVWERRKLCIQIAGLCHDVGHGPFSHLWETFRARINPGDNWAHETESVRILDEIMNQPVSPTKKINEVEFKNVRDAFEYCGLTKDDLNSIKTMILGQEEPKNYMFQIVNNKNNDIDVDKWDYLTRDSAMLNVPIAFDYKRLLNYCCVLPNDEGDEQICFREKECSVLVEMFLARGRLHDNAYQHIKVKIIEEMLLEALELANERLRLTSVPVTQLTDHIYQQILYEDFGVDKNMWQAKKILRRIESRHLYKLIARETFQDCLPNEQEIKFRLKAIPELEPYVNDIAVSFIKLDMTKSNLDTPLKNVVVYQRKNGQSQRCKKFNWVKYEDSLKFNIENLKRKQVIILYKGNKKFPKMVKQLVKQHLNEICFR